MTDEDRCDPGWRQVLVGADPESDERERRRGLSDVPGFERDRVVAAIEDAEQERRFTELSRRQIKRAVIETNLLMLSMLWIGSWRMPMFGARMWGAPSWGGYALLLFLLGPLTGWLLFRFTEGRFLAGAIMLLAFVAVLALDHALFGGGPPVNPLFWLFMICIFIGYGTRREFRSLEG